MLWVHKTSFSFLRINESLISSSLYAFLIVLGLIVNSWAIDVPTAAVHLVLIPRL